MRHFLALCAALLVASTAHAAADNTWGKTVNGAATGCNVGASVGASGMACFDFDSTLSPATTAFSVSDSALACLRPDLGTIGAKTATAIVYFCPTGITTSTTTCGIIAGVTAGTTLDGTNGAPSAQKTCVPLGPGVYFVDFTALPAGAEVGVLTVQGGK